MRARSALIAAVAVALAATTPAGAAVKKVTKICNIVVDQKGDANWGSGGGLVKPEAVDVLSADIATGAKEFVAVLRVAKIDFANDNWSNLGYSWRVGATANGFRYEFEKRRGMGPNPTESDTVTVNGVAVPHTFAFVGNTLVWKFNRAAVKPMAKPKLVWGDFGAFGYVMSSTADNASSEKKYSDRAPSCVIAK